MNRFFITFGQASPLKAGYFEVLAPSEGEVRLFASEYPHWCGCYPEDAWIEGAMGVYFPAGRIGGVVSLPKVNAPAATQSEDCAIAQPEAE